MIKINREKKTDYSLSFQNTNDEVKIIKQKKYHKI